jgi:hypothetical protein
MRRFLPLLAMLLAGCAAPAREPPAAAPPPPMRRAEAAPFERWDVTASQLAVRVYRDGPMQKLGHDHLITSTAVQGVIQMREPLAKSGFDLTLPLESLVVDDPGARASVGEAFAAPVPQKDRDATRKNMLGESVLDAARQPVLRLSANGIEGQPGAFSARVRVGLGGEEHEVTTPLKVTIDGARLSAHASLKLKHSDIGLVPFNVALGALRVRDDIDVEIVIEARRAS